MNKIGNAAVSEVDQISQDVSESRFLKACRGEKADATPVWFMRQAGRYMPEYRAIRAKHTMLETIANPDLAAEITLQPMNAFGFDAAIVFSDILPLLVGMGLELDFVKGKGPLINNPIRSVAQVENLTIRPAVETMAGTLETVKIVSQELAGRGLPLIGFAGAPFTLACYGIEGAGSKTYDKARQFMLTEQACWHQLMDKLVTVTADYLLQQASHGASALQIFDSWAGVLSKADYIKFVQPHNTKLFDLVSAAGVPVVNFSTGTNAYLEEVVSCGGDVIGVDWRLGLSDSWNKIGDRPIQGNLDPISLLAPWQELKSRTDIVLAEANDKPGHIFNLGHGILPATSMDQVRQIVDYVHEQTAS